MLPSSLPLINSPVNYKSNILFATCHARAAVGGPKELFFLNFFLSREAQIIQKRGLKSDFSRPRRIQEVGVKRCCPDQQSCGFGGCSLPSSRLGAGAGGGCLILGGDLAQMGCVPCQQLSPCCAGGPRPGARECCSPRRSWLSPCCCLARYL